MIYSLIGYTILVIILGLYVVLSLRTDGWRRYIGPLVYIVLVGFSFISLLLSLGYAKPHWLYYNLPSMEVLGVVMQEGKSIYVWGVIQGEEEPVAIMLPWSEGMAKEVQTEGDTAGKEGTPLVFGPNSEGDIKFYPKPIEALPLKNGEER